MGCKARTLCLPIPQLLNSKGLSQQILQNCVAYTSIGSAKHAKHTKTFAL